MTRLLLALAATALLLLAAYFILIVISAANAKTPPPNTHPDLHLRPRKPLPCVACVPLMAPPERP